MRNLSYDKSILEAVAGLGFRLTFMRVLSAKKIRSSGGIKPVLLFTENYCPVKDPFQDTWSCRGRRIAFDTDRPVTYIAGISGDVCV
ncbi:MAG: hypothetical protein JRJ04_00915 [Deltaproteobacteria bacterium]|nr:hypothetical protein [Deltaproteobacteria bacterium]